MLRRGIVATIGAATLVLVMAACSSSSNQSGGGAGASAGVSADATGRCDRLGQISDAVSVGLDNFSGAEVEDMILEAADLLPPGWTNTSVELRDWASRPSQWLFVPTLIDGYRNVYCQGFDGSTVEAVLGDYFIKGNLTAPAGEVSIHAVNQGATIHNVGVRRGPISGDIRPGGDFTLNLGVLVPGTYELYCDLPQHIAKGMVANLVIT